VPLQPGEAFDRYVIAALLGKGGMGEVYRAHDPRLQRAVALKILSTEFVEGPSFSSGSRTEGLARLLREARAAAALEHPNAVAVYDVGEVNGTAYMAMEFIAGQTLRAYIRDATVSLETRVRWLVDVAKALAAAHKRGLIHRDIKPENVMVRDDGVVKVLDFGIARRVASNVDASAPTEAAVTTSATGKTGIAGTPAYMAPEQLRERTINAFTDQFSWGVMAYELLTGRLPWREEIDSLQVVTDILSMKPKPPSEATKLVFPIPEEIDDVVLMALEKDAPDRFASMGDVVAALEPFAGVAESVSRRSMPVGARSRSGTGRRVDLRASRWRSWRTWAAAGAVFALLGGIGLWRAYGTPMRATSPAAPPTSASAGTMTENSEAASAYAAGMQSMRDADIEGAERNFDRAIELDSGFAAAYLRRALVAPELDARVHECFAKATQLRERLSDHDRTVLRAYEPLMGSPPDARVAAAHFEEALTRSPDDPDYLLHLAEAHLLDGDATALIETVNRLLQRDPDMMDALRIEGLVLGDSDRTADAIPIYRRCLMHSPNAGACALDLETVLADQGACADLEALARDRIARSPEVRHAHRYLAEALFAQGAPVPAVAAALADDRRLRPATMQRVSEIWDAEAMDVLRGDFAAAAARGDSVEVPGWTAHAGIHAKDTLFAMRVAFETDRPKDIARLAADYDSQRAAWPVDEFSTDRSIEVYALAYRAGVMSRGDFAARRARWLAENTKRGGLFQAYRAKDLWFWSHAVPCASTEAAEEAIAALAGGSPPSSFSEQESEEPIGEVYQRAGQLDAAERVLRRASRQCLAIRWPFETTWATFHLGEVLEAKGDRAGACEAYVRVLARWGAPKPSSRTGSAAASRFRALNCAR
jgi:serine/threonine-protein kinase